MEFPNIEDFAQEFDDLATGRIKYVVFQAVQSRLTLYGKGPLGSTYRDFFDVIGACRTPLYGLIWFEYSPSHLEERPARFYCLVGWYDASSFTD